MLSIAIDAFRLVAEPRTSHAIYAYELVSSLSAFSEITKLYLLIPRRPENNCVLKALLKSEKVELLFPLRDAFPEKRFLRQIYWIQREIPRLIRHLNRPIDFYIASYHHPPLFLGKKIRVITVIHDLCGLRQEYGYPKTKKGFYRHLFMFWVAAIRSNMLIPISEYTRTALINRFPYASAKVSEVVYNGVSSAPIDSSLVQDVLEKYALSRRRYFIAFGATGPRKALDLTLGATLSYRNQGGQASLVLIVGSEHRVAVHQLASELKLDDIFMLSDLDSVERDALYKGALALLFPSRCEGFGYPIVEAMRQGCPPIAWLEGPAKEIVGSASPLVAHLDPREIAGQMSFFESLAPEDRSELADRLVERSLIFESGSRFGSSFLHVMKRAG